MVQALIVEDEIALQGLYKRILENSGYEVITADNGQQAIDALKNLNAPDLIILDIRMPICNGYQVIEYLQSYPNIASIHVVIVTATQKFQDYCDLLPSTEFILKPVLPSHLNELASRHRMML